MVDSTKFKRIRFLPWQFGTSTDKPVQGDYTGDGKADIAIWRPSNGNWFILRSEDFSVFRFPFGANGDIPVAGDYDGDGKTDAGVFRPSNSTWFVQRTTAGTLIQQFGTPETSLSECFRALKGSEYAFMREVFDVNST